MGILISVSMGFRSPASGDGETPGSKIEIIKGVVTDSDHDSAWDEVTFGLTGLTGLDYTIVSIDLFDKKGRFIASVIMDSDLDKVGEDGENGWFSIDLNQYKVHKEFTMAVRVKSISNTTPKVSSSLSAASLAAAPPIEPDETILIVKYP